MTRAQVLSQTFNGRVEWGVEGGYFKILTAGANLQVELYLGAVLVLLAPTVKAGFYQRAQFDRVVLTNSGSQLTEVLIAPDQGGSDAFTANSLITGPLDADNADAAAVLGANGLVAVASRLKAFNGATWDRLRVEALFSRFALRVSEQGYAYGAVASTNAIQGAAAAVQLVAPGTNVNGIIVWYAEILTKSAALNHRGAILAKASAPTSEIDGDIIVSGTTYSETAAPASTTGGCRDRPLLIPAGKGIYKFNVLAESIALGNVHYTVL